MIFETERLILRPWCEEDAESCYTYAKDPDVGPSAGWPAHQDVEQSREIIKTALNGPECYAICLKETNEAIGCIELMLHGTKDKTNSEDECELGFWLGKPYWGRGLVPEAANRLIDHAFEDLGMNKIWCGYYAGNTKSKRTQEKLGFVFKYSRKNVPVRLLNEVRDENINVLTRSMWEEKSLKK